MKIFEIIIQIEKNQSYINFPDWSLQDIENCSIQIFGCNIRKDENNIIMPIFTFYECRLVKRALGELIKNKLKNLK